MLMSCQGLKFTKVSYNSQHKQLIADLGSAHLDETQLWSHSQWSELCVWLFSCFMSTRKLLLDLGRRGERRREHSAVSSVPRSSLSAFPPSRLFHCKYIITDLQSAMEPQWNDTVCAFLKFCPLSLQGYIYSGTEHQTCNLSDVIFSFLFGNTAVHVSSVSREEAQRLSGATLKRSSS